MKILQNKYTQICNEYVKEFARKNDLDFTEWKNEVGEIATFNNSLFSFNFKDIMTDVNTNQKELTIIKWHFRNLELDKKEITYKKYIEYETT